VTSIAPDISVVCSSNGAIRDSSMRPERALCAWLALMKKLCSFLLCIVAITVGAEVARAASPLKIVVVKSQDLGRPSKINLDGNAATHRALRLLRQENPV
jgi:hypothetical protein